MTTKAAANPTKADIVRLLVIQALSEAEKRQRNYLDNGSAASGQNAARLRGEVAGLDRLKSKVVAYLDRGDISVLIR